MWAARASSEDLLARSEFNQVLISPTGEYLAITKMEGGEARFVIYSMPARKLVVNNALGENFEAADMTWVGDEYVVVAPARRMFDDCGDEEVEQRMEQLPRAALGPTVRIGRKIALACGESAARALRFSRTSRRRAD